MADTSIFEIDNRDIDLKNYQKVNIPVALNDTVILKFNIFNENAPVNLEEFNIEFRAYLPKSTVPYSQTDNITKSGNTLTIICDKELCQEIGQIQATLRIWNTQMLQKSNYLIVLKVMSTIPSDEVISSVATISGLNSLDWSINRYVELKADLNSEIVIAEDLIVQLTSKLADGTILNLALEKNIADGNVLDDSLTIKNTEANSNIIELDTQNSDAITNVATLISKNSEAVINNNNLINNILTAGIVQNNLDNSNTQAVINNNTLSSSISDAETTIDELKLTNSNYTNHIHNADIHVTKSEKEIWNHYEIVIQDLMNQLQILMPTSYLVDESGNYFVDESGNRFIV